MTVTAKRINGRAEIGTAITDFTASLVMFFCFFFVPVIDMAFVPARYLMVHTYLDSVVHRMALSEKRSQAIKYLNDPSWKTALNTFGVTVKNAQINLRVTDSSAGKSLSLPGSTEVPKEWLPHSRRPGQTRVYSLELSVNVDVPPLFNGNGGLPGFSSPIAFTFRNRAQWENLSPDPLETGDPGNPKYYINQ